MESSLLYIQACQNGRQTHIALFEIGNSGHDLLIGSVAAGLFQLDGQICQFPGMGGIVAGHVLHQSQQLLHGGMLALRAAGSAAALTAMGMGVGMVLAMEMVMGMGMLVIVGMGMAMLMGVRYAIVGVLMGVGMSMLMVMMVMMSVFVIDMHKKYLVSFSVFCTDIIIATRAYVKTFIFPEISPRGACVKGQSMVKY